MEKQQPPKVLVETWVHLLKQNDDKALKKHGEAMLLGAFGSMEKVADYMKTHNLQI